MQSNLEIKKPKREKKPGLEIPANIALEQDSSTVPHVATEAVAAPKKKRRVKTLEEKIAEQNKETATLEFTAPTITRKKREAKTVRTAREQVSRTTDIDSKTARELNNHSYNIETPSSIVTGGPHESIVYTDHDPVFVEHKLDPSNYKKLTDAVEGKVSSGEYTLLSDENAYDPLFDGLEDREREIAHQTRNYAEAANRSIHPISNKEHSFYKTNDFERTQRNLKNYSDSKIERNNRGFLSNLKNKILDYFVKDEDFEDDE